MTYRVADSELALTLEVAWSGVPAVMKADLQHHDRHRRGEAVAALASHLAARTRCYEIIGKNRDRSITLACSRGCDMAEMTWNALQRLFDDEPPLIVWREERGLSVTELAERSDIALERLLELEADMSLATWRSLI